MKRLILAMAFVTLTTACTQPAPEAAPESTEVAATETAAPAVMAADGKSPVGKYRITASDGKVFEEDVRADGTYTQTIDGKVSETGKWNQKAADTYCYTVDKEGATEVCNSEKIENGVWSSTSPDGKTAKVERIEG